MSDFVEEADLDCPRFWCCGDEDLYPFGCPGCGRLMVLCTECDTLHADLDQPSDPSSLVYLDPADLCIVCPHCQHRFEPFFPRDNLHKVTRARWIAAGYGHLLSDRRDDHGA